VTSTREGTFTRVVQKLVLGETETTTSTYLRGMKITRKPIEKLARHGVTVLKK